MYRGKYRGGERRRRRRRVKLVCGYSTFQASFHKSAWWRDGGGWRKLETS